MACDQNRVLEIRLEGGATFAGMTPHGELGMWQRRYWEHTIRDDQDFAADMDYTHFNLAAHGLVGHPADWLHSSFRPRVASGLYPAGWGAAAPSRKRLASAGETGTGARADRLSAGMRYAVPPYACWPAFCTSKSRPSQDWVGRGGGVLAGERGELVGGSKMNTEVFCRLTAAADSPGTRP